MRNYRVYFPPVATVGSEAGEQTADLLDPAAPRSSLRLFPSPREVGSRPMSRVRGN